ncbi:MAG: hypothetical protein GKR89_08465 [Candidatus Latescibacteria bacterium]|nr:hypothetical protein [Candidatus Latescibacterota bacterium]
MPICSYIVFPRPGATRDLSGRLEALEGCRVEVAQNKDLLLLLTDTESAGDEEALQTRLKEIDDIQCMVLTFGALDEGAGETYEN